MVQYGVFKVVQEFFGAKIQLKEVNATFLVLIPKVSREDSMDFFRAKSLLKDVNATFLVLIPKVSGAYFMDLFRPISLCNSFYKIISNVLANRIIKILPIIIAP